MYNSPSENILLKLNLNESQSNSNSSKNIHINSKESSRYKNKISSNSISSRSSKRPTLHPENRQSLSGFFNYNDKVEKKMYLENINLRTKRNTELLSKLSSTFRSARMFSSSRDPLIEANLFKIGTKRSNILTRNMNKVRNMIQNFDNEFSVNLNINKNNKNFFSKNNINRNSLQKIEEESFDFDLNNINSKNQSVNSENNNNNSKKKSLKKKSLLITTNFFENLNNDKGQKYKKNNAKIEKKLNNSEKFLQLTDAFKYYELLYNYKYFLTKKDNEFLTFSRRKKLERAMSSCFPKSKTKLYKKEENCEKCKSNKKSDIKAYNNCLNEILKKKVTNFNDYESEKNNSNGNKELELSLGNTNNNKKMKRAFSGFISKNTDNQNIFLTSHTRPTTSSIPPTSNTSKYTDSNKIKFKSKLKNELDLESVISTSSYKTNLINYKKNNTINPKRNLFSLNKKVRNLSEGILDTGEELKKEIKLKYKSIMKQIEEEKKPVSKVKKDRNINIKKIRNDLNLKRRGNGIDEKKLIMENVDKLYKSLPKTHVNLMRSIAKIVINEDRMRHRPLFYNDTYDNKLFKMRLKDEMFEAQREMGKIRKSLSKNKKEKNFKQQMKKLMKNEMFLFFDLDSLKQMLNKYKVLRGECLSNNQ